MSVCCYIIVIVIVLSSVCHTCILIALVSWFSPFEHVLFFTASVIVGVSAAMNPSIIINQNIENTKQKHLL